jgi:HK97 family phage portal protein
VKLSLSLEREKRSGASSPENPTVPVSADSFLAFFGVQSASLPNVTIDRALTSPPVLAAVAFLSRTLAALPMHAYRRTKAGPVRITGKLETVVHDAPNDGMDSFKFRQYFWQQVFTGGRGLAFIERTPQGIDSLWPMDPAKTAIRREGARIVYRFEGKIYEAADVIDVPFMLRTDGFRHFGPIALASKAIQLALAMNDYASQFFAGGGVPPLAFTGPLPQGQDALKRAMDDIHRVIDAAKSSNKPIFPMPPGHDLKQIGFDPEKGQMTDARRFQTEEIARVYQLPPVFLQDLTRATFTNAEQQDLHLVKHNIAQWAQALEGEMNLKLFGRNNRGRYVEHNLDGILRGDFKSRIEGIARAIQSGLMEPNRGRDLMNWPHHTNPAANDLFIQGATVPLGTYGGGQPAAPNSAPDDGDDNGDDN